MCVWVLCTKRVVTASLIINLDYSDTCTLAHMHTQYHGMLCILTMVLKLPRSVVSRVPIGVTKQSICFLFADSTACHLGIKARSHLGTLFAQLIIPASWVVCHWFRASSDHRHALSPAAPAGGFGDNTTTVLRGTGGYLCVGRCGKPGMLMSQGTRGVQYV